MFASGNNHSKKYSYLLGLQEIKAPRISSNRHMKVVSHRLPLPLGRYSWHSFLLQAESTPVLQCGRKGNQTRELSACSGLEANQGTRDDWLATKHLTVSVIDKKDYTYRWTSIGLVIYTGSEAHTVPY
jgi:hypothetical protein